MIFTEKKSQEITVNEKILIKNITETTSKNNLDNISRTNAYFQYYKENKEIIWAFLASMVSRNAGWNMCDLEGTCFPKIIKPEMRKRLFYTYERANWLIFQDAFPQLLLYQYSTKINRPMFHLLKFLHVSAFMEKEWQYFWVKGNIKRLMISLIINEQNVIQKPVINHPIYKRKVFHSVLFSFQDWFHFSSVIFPTCEGKLFGASVNEFKSISKRVDLGKRLANILFAADLYPAFYEFACKTVHTGSRNDYERYIRTSAHIPTPILRCTYPIIDHHIHHYEDWSLNRRIKNKWKRTTVQHRHPVLITKWYLKKQKQLKRAAGFSAFIGLTE